MVLIISLLHTPLQCNPSPPVDASLLILYYHHSSCISGSHSLNQYKSPLSSQLLDKPHNLCLGEMLDNSAISPNPAVITFPSMPVTL